MYWMNKAEWQNPRPLSSNVGQNVKTNSFSIRKEFHRLWLHENSFTLFRNFLFAHQNLNFFVPVVVVVIRIFYTKLKHLQFFE